MILSLMINHLPWQIFIDRIKKNQTFNREFGVLHFMKSKKSSVSIRKYFAIILIFANSQYLQLLKTNIIN